MHARFDAGMTGEVLPVLWPVVPEAERVAYPGRLEEFVDTYRERLVLLFAEYGPQSAIAKHGRHELLAHPVSLIILERLTAARFALAMGWDGELPDRWLNDLCGPWGIAEVL
ncbi:hypothetical protein [Streptomyces cremeus]|uniref:Uncharacterized protein n=1 Tax=Streptomyces cremeus TaxID=66881 RepID=A0ABV5PK91_STRCM